jgi:hypothetical protein
MGLSVLAGLSAGVTLSERRMLMAQTTPGADNNGPYTGRMFIFVHTGGGWDPTMVCDPKGGEVNRLFPAGNFPTAGNIPYAPVNYPNEAGGYSNQQFFERLAPNLMVINGVDQQTNNHDGGTRFTWSGRLEDGYPPLAALVAASLAPGRPLGFLSSGGYENTQSVVPVARINDLGTIARIAYPNRADPSNMMATYHADATRDRIQQFQAARLQAMINAQTLPTYRQSMQQLLTTRGGGNLLQRLMSFLPTNDEINASNNGVYRQGMVALAAYQAGVTAAANLSTGGFDTHGNHDVAQADALGRLLHGVQLLWERVERLQLQDRVTIMVGSDFGRTPFYNNGRGKDHWSVSSVLMIGAGVPGNRVVGATDGMHRARGINPTTLQVDDGSQTKLHPSSIHLSLRRLAGIDQSELARQFPIPSNNENINLFA